MAIYDIEELRPRFPGFYEDREEDVPWDDYIVIPTHAPGPAEEGELPDTERDRIPEPADRLDDILGELFGDIGPELDPQLVERFGNHPGGLHNQPQGHRSTIIERLAFYLPFHSWPRWWGIYVLPEGIGTLRRELEPILTGYGVGFREQVLMAKRILYFHEFYHHATESFATRLETILNRPCYLGPFHQLYQTTHLTKDCLEESCANSYARERVVALTKLARPDRSATRRCINSWFAGAPPGYREASLTGAAWQHAEKPRFLEQCMGAVGTQFRSPIAARSVEVAWTTARFFDRSIGDVRSRFAYLIPKNHPLLNRIPLDIRTCLKTGAFKRKLARLRIAHLSREGASHEIWESRDGRHRCPIGRHDQHDIPKGTLQAILRQLGSPMTVDAFLAA